MCPPRVFSLDGGQSCDKYYAIHISRRGRYGAPYARGPSSRGQGRASPTHCPRELIRYVFIQEGLLNRHSNQRVLLRQIQVESVDIHLVAAQRYGEGAVGCEAQKRGASVAVLEQGFKVNEQGRLVGYG